MEINKEEARRLWEAQFGKNLTPCDFAGRQMNKASYNDRNSKYGWNVDHILPLSRGGKTADHNLICCHVLTNDEKADKFPCFKANGQSFEIQKRQNHYEIFSKSEQNSEDEEEQYNLMDYAQGLACWKACKRQRPKEQYVQYAKIQLVQHPLSKTFLFRFRNFLEYVFSEAVIFAEQIPSYYSLNQDEVQFTAIRFDAPMVEDDQEWLDATVELNTYASAYFERKYGCTIRICCGMSSFENQLGVTPAQIEKEIMDKKVPFYEHLSIDEEIRTNTDAADNIDCTQKKSGFYPYNYTFTKLRKQLEKQE